MARLNLSLPDDVRALADEQVNAGRYPSVSEYVASLIREDLHRRGVETKLIQRVAAGPARPMTDADFDTIRGRVEDEIARRQRGQ